MATESFLPGFGMVNDTRTNESLLPGFGMVDETVAGGPPEPPADPMGQALLMRHGTWFGSGVKQRMWWAR